MKLRPELLVLQLLVSVLAAQCPAPSELLDEMGAKICARLFGNSPVGEVPGCKKQQRHDIPFIPFLGATGSPPWWWGTPPN